MSRARFSCCASAEALLQVVLCVRPGRMGVCISATAAHAAHAPVPATSPWLTISTESAMSTTNSCGHQEMLDATASAEPARYARTAARAPRVAAIWVSTCVGAGCRCAAAGAAASSALRRVQRAPAACMPTCGRACCRACVRVQASHACMPACVCVLLCVRVRASTSKCACTPARRRAHLHAPHACAPARMAPAAPPCPSPRTAGWSPRPLLRAGSAAAGRWRTRGGWTRKGGR